MFKTKTWRLRNSIPSYVMINFQVLSVENVLSYKDQHFWQQSADMVVGTISVQVAPTTIEARVIQQVVLVFAFLMKFKFIREAASQYVNAFRPLDRFQSINVFDKKTSLMA